jgi:hypothetical protein
MHETISKSGTQGADYTLRQIEVPPDACVSNLEPEFIRLPRPKERCALSQLSRTTLCELIAEGKIRAVKLRKRGAVRGITLINLWSLLQYLHRLEK